MSVSFTQVNGVNKFPCLVTSDNAKILTARLYGSADIFAPVSLPSSSSTWFSSNLPSPQTIAFNGRDVAPGDMGKYVTLIGGPLYEDKQESAACRYAYFNGTQYSYIPVSIPDLDATEICAIGARFGGYRNFNIGLTNANKLNNSGITSYISKINADDFPNGADFIHGLIVGFPTSWEMYCINDSTRSYSGGVAFPGKIWSASVNTAYTCSLHATHTGIGYLTDKTLITKIATMDGFDVFASVVAYTLENGILSLYETKELVNGNAMIFKPPTSTSTGNIRLYDSFMGVHKI